MSLTFSDSARAEIEQLMTRYPTREAVTLPVLRVAEREFGGEILRWLIQTFPGESSATAAEHKLHMEGFAPPPRPRKPRGVSKRTGAAKPGTTSGKKGAKKKAKAANVPQRGNKTARKAATVSKKTTGKTAKKKKKVVARQTKAPAKKTSKKAAKKKASPRK